MFLIQLCCSFDKESICMNKQCNSSVHTFLTLELPHYPYGYETNCIIGQESFYSTELRNVDDSCLIQ